MTAQRHGEAGGSPAYVQRRFLREDGNGAGTWQRVIIGPLTGLQGPSDRSYRSRSICDWRTRRFLARNVRHVPEHP